jgi:hypothetical protein
VSVLSDAERTPIRPTGRDPVRPLPAGHVRPTRYRWPSERATLPTRCDHCGAALILGDVPTADYPVVDISCLFCSRLACELVHDGLRSSLPFVAERCACGAVAGYEQTRECRECRRARIYARKESPV